MKGPEYVFLDEAQFVGGWGKVDAAASAQYAIDRWHPDAIINPGTCGGIVGQFERYEIILANRTVIYDIVEMMGDSTEAIRDYTTTIDLAWLGPKLPSPVRRGVLVSADRDLSPADIPKRFTERSPPIGSPEPSREWPRATASES